MSDKTGIEWTDATWNPIRGCSRVSEGCRHCYAETITARFCGEGQPYEGLIRQTSKGPRWNGNITVVEKAMDQPTRWKKPRRIFVNSMSDLFHPNVGKDVIDRVFEVMLANPRHTFQVLTKRPERMRAYIASGWSKSSPLPGHIWIGVSVEDQSAADARIPLLLKTPGATRWVSAEPLLGPVRLGTKRLDWVVVGGESGKGARPMDPQWARWLRDECEANGIPFLFKQWGGYGEDGVKRHKKLNGRLLDGVLHDVYPVGVGA